MMVPRRRKSNQLKAEVASLRQPSVEVGAELLGKYAGDGNWYDVIVEADSASTDGARIVPLRDYGNAVRGRGVVGSARPPASDDRDAL